MQLRQLLTVTVLFIAPSFAATLVINDTETLIRFPFGTDVTSTTNYQSGATYQQIYSSQEFTSSPILITQVAFSTSSSISDATSASLALDVHLGVAATSAANPSATFSMNRGANYQDVFSRTLTFTPALNNTFDMGISLSSPFFYNPSMGDLLLDIQITQAPRITGSALYFGGDSSDTDNRIFSASPSTTGRVDFNTLATQFTFSPQATTTPEPSSLFLLITGISAMAFVRGRSRAQAVK